MTAVIDSTVLTREDRADTHSDRVVFLDSLRLIGASAVVFQHFAEQAGPIGSLIVETLSPGVFGVVLFFIVSGFVMPLSISRGFDWKDFAVRRFFRIYPLALAVFILVALTGYTGLITSFSFVNQLRAYDWLANLLLVQDYAGATPIWGVTWTLSLEVLWYAIFVFSVIRLGRSYSNILATLFPALLIGLALASMVIDHRIPLARPGMIYAAVLGCQFYRYHVGEIGSRRMLFDLAAFILVTSFNNVISFGYFKHPNITLNQSLYPWIGASLLFAAVALLPKVRSSRLIRSRIVRWLAVTSYSIYLLHPLAWAITEQLAFNTRDLIIAALGLTIVLSALGYYLIELPSQKLGRRLATKLFKRPDPENARLSRAQG